MIEVFEVIKSSLGYYFNAFRAFCFGILAEARQPLCQEE
ncbi:hypothetical protein COK_0556 [Mannheimia haemolytica serotype A2 str. BOVINE]|nr:hypothetical protein COK_0556 [Mannheimia haemolytica serotype A2 str. BOVINE]